MLLTVTLLFIAFLLFIIIVALAFAGANEIYSDDLIGLFFVALLFAFVFFIVAIIIFVALLVLIIEFARFTGMLDIYTCVMYNPVSFSWPKNSILSMLRFCLSN